MKFADIPVADALGWRLAHSVRAGTRRFGKGHELTAADCALIGKSGAAVVTAFRLETGDIDEDTAAAMIADLIASPGLEPDKASRGRVNLRATVPGVLIVGDRIDALNAVDEAVTIATLPDQTPVRAGQLVATVKIIPYAVPVDVLEKCKLLHGATKSDGVLLHDATIQLSAFRPYGAALISSAARDSGKLEALTEARLAATGGRLVSSTCCSHVAEALAGEILAAAAREDIDIILLSGISAISDRRDTVPAALVQAGGSITRLGMPADPGNLLMLGDISGKTVIGLPGCARSPARNGFDTILARFSAGLPLGSDAVAGLGRGGFLLGAPRPEAIENEAKTGAGFAAILLAAGRSSRAGSHKLLSELGGKPVICHSAENALSAGLDLLVVTGHAGDRIASALSDKPLEIINNPDHASGIASSLVAGLRALEGDWSGVFAALGDMPFVRPSTYRQLIDFSKESDALILIPTFHGKRGNPVLWRPAMLPALLDISGDRGGRDIIHQNPDLVAEVPVDDPGILIDLDTPEALKSFGIKAVEQ
ncbi:MAG: 4-diphosphocytidyl-2C-methyl-D-erythritol kinase [Alphaproteobacteria bacterium]|nr:MAG: 4-diphosphocytidyl-2C-methyl-D-erythritol kinase [Alphaproteobacteria bacterium]